MAVFAPLLGCAAALPPVSAVQIPPIPRGDARIWIYRDYEPYVSLARPYVRFNGAVVGISEPAGGAFYRNVPPGDYYVTVDSDGQDVNQWANVAVVPRQQVYIKVEALRWWDCGGLGRGYWCRDTFYTVLQLPQVGAAEVAAMPFTAGR
jgi:hypothetical protein